MPTRANTVVVIPMNPVIDVVVAPNEIPQPDPGDVSWPIVTEIPTPTHLDDEIPTTGAGTLYAERVARIAGDDELRALLGAAQNGVGELISQVVGGAIENSEAERRAAEAAINQALADELAARAAADALEAAARTELATATTTALAQASADIQAAHDAADQAAQDAADALATAQAEIMQSSADAAAALAAAQSTLQGAIDTARSDLNAAISAVQDDADGVIADLAAEVTARQDGDSAEVTARQTAIAGVQSSIGTVAAALTTETTNRANADAAEVTARQAAIAGVQSDVSTVAAGLASEISARATADTAETNARQTAVSQVQTNLNTVSSALTAEASTRATNDATETSQRQAAVSSLQGQINDATAAITAEASTRSTNDTAETSARTAAVSNLQGQINSTNAAITSEASTRATADTAETSARQAAISSLQTDVAAANAAITAEQNTRASADTAETSARQAQVSSVQAAADFEAFKVWNFDSSDEGFTAATSATLAYSNGAIQINSTGGDPQLISPGGLSIDASLYKQIRVRLKRLAGSGWDGKLFYSISGGHGSSGTPGQYKQFSQPANLSTDWCLLDLDMSTTDWSGTITQLRFDFGASAGDQFLIDWIAVGRMGPSKAVEGLASANAAITAEANTRATNDATETSQRQAAVSSLQGQINDATAAITAEASTRSTNDTAETSARTAAVSNLQGQINSTNAALTSESSTRASADSAETTARQNAISSVQTDIANVNAALTNEASTRSSADAAETSARQAAVSALQGDIATANAAISNEASTRATADAAETAARQAQVSAWSAKGSPKRVWTQSTAPTFDQIFPPGVQACPLGNLDVANPWDSNGIGTWTNTGRTVSRGVDLGGWTLDGEHTIYAYLNGNWAAQSTYECFDFDGFGEYVGVVPGATYEFSAYTGAHRSLVFIEIAWYNIAGAVVGYTGAANANDWQAGDGATLDGYKRLWARGVAPAGAVRAQPYMRCDNQGANNKAGQASPFIFATRPQWTRVPSGSPAPIDWQPYDAPAWINTGDSYRVLRWSGLFGATWVEYSDTRIAANAAAITAEAATRASADSAETSQRQAAISGVQTQIDSTNAALASEASTRATADSAETSARQSAVSGLQNSVNSINAAIVTEQNTRASADEAETTSRRQQVSQLTTPGGALTDPLFARSPIAANSMPWGWSDWSYGPVVCSIVAGKIGDRAVQITDPGSLGQNTGFHLASTWGNGAWAGADHRTTRYFVVEVDFEYVSGDLLGSGVLVYGEDNIGTTNWSFFHFGDVAPSPIAGRIYSLRKFFDGHGQRVPPVLSQCATIFHVFGGWSTLYADKGASAASAKTIVIQRANVRAATQTEIENGTVGGAVGAAITSEANTRATAIAAETSARTAAVSSLTDGLNSANAAIATEANTRATADSAEATARTTLSSALSAQINPKRIFTVASAPTFSELFPVGVQACPVANLKPSDGLNGLDKWTNTARTVDSFQLFTDGSWNLTGESSVGAHLQGAWAAAATYEYFDINSWGQCYNVVAGARYEWSVYTGSHRCRTFVGIYFYDDNWNYLGGAESTGGGSALYTLGGVNNSEKSGGGSGTLADWKRLGVIVQAPAGATRANFFVRSDNQGSSATGQTDPYCFACRPYFGRARPDQTTFTDWQPFQPALWLKSSENNKAYLWSGIYGAGFVAADDSRISANSATISQLMSTTDGLKAMWGVQIDVNGEVTGRVKLDGTGGTSEFSVLATSFTVSMPGYNSPIFEVGSVNGSPKVTIRADVVADGSITDGKVGNVNLTAPTFANGNGSASVTVALRGGQTVAIIAKGAGYIGSNGGQVLIKQGATTLASEYAGVISVRDYEGNYNYTALPVVLMASYTPPSDGNYTLQVTTIGYPSAPAVSIYVARPYK